MNNDFMSYLLSGEECYESVSTRKSIAGNNLLKALNGFSVCLNYAYDYEKNFTEVYYAIQVNFKVCSLNLWIFRPTGHFALGFSWKRNSPSSSVQSTAL